MVTKPARRKTTRHADRDRGILQVISRTADRGP